MKKQILLVVALFISLSMFSQRAYRALGWKLTRDLPKNELKINLPTSIFASFPEITYERVLDSDISVGAALGVSLDNDLYPVNFAFTPYFRWFFGGNSENMQRYGAGFFIEANAGLISVDTHNAEYTDETFVSTYEKDMGAGLGLAVGWKYLTRNSWIGEVYLGGGRDFVNEGAYPRMGISVGKRF